MCKDGVELACPCVPIRRARMGGTCLRTPNHALHTTASSPDYHGRPTFPRTGRASSEQRRPRVALLHTHSPLHILTLTNVCDYAITHLYVSARLQKCTFAIPHFYV
jgi:hypothetical protein